ncbi:MAG: seg [Parcubacteria group bacterium]|nr:seg [Parcubacteria group bacterium]
MKKGFTLIEILTAISIFLVIMTISMGAIIGIFNANNKVGTQKTTIDNLNFAVETMSREMRFGSKYHCDTSAQASPPFTTPTNCILISQPGRLVSFLANDGVTQIVYRFNGTSLEKSVDGTASTPTYTAVTAPEINIQNLEFYVLGSGPDLLQPKVIIKIRGSAGARSSDKSDFSLETLVSQRSLDS